MKSKALNFFLFLLLMAAGYYTAIFFDTLRPVFTPASPAPVFAFTDINGKEQKLEDYRGKVIILNFWASWCPPCVAEFPHLVEAAAKHKDKAVLIALSSDLKHEDMTRFLDAMTARGHDWEESNIIMALDENQAITAGLYGTSKLPETIIITPDLMVYDRLIGASWSARDLDALIVGAAAKTTP